VVWQNPDELRPNSMRAVGQIGQLDAGAAKRSRPFIGCGSVRPGVR
jgi:hypothetical protein